jgi:hypothetical protein
LTPTLLRHLLVRKGEAIYTIAAGQHRRLLGEPVQVEGFVTLVHVRDKTGGLVVAHPEDLL